MGAEALVDPRQRQVTEEHGSEAIVDFLEVDGAAPERIAQEEEVGPKRKVPAAVTGFTRK